MTWRPGISLEEAGKHDCSGGALRLSLDGSSSRREKLDLSLLCDFSNLKFKEPKSFMIDFVVGFEREMIFVYNSEEKKRGVAMLSWPRPRKGRGLGN